MIPSVCDIPSDIEGSFYTGQVYIWPKEPSSALRHATELNKIITQRNLNHQVLVLYTDGGPDHSVVIDLPHFEPPPGYASGSMFFPIPFLEESL